MGDTMVQTGRLREALRRRPLPYPPTPHGERPVLLGPAFPLKEDDDA